jgi:hypothetical protein
MLGVPDTRRGWAGDAWASMLESCLREWSTAAMGRVWMSEIRWDAGPPGYEEGVGGVSPPPRLNRTPGDIRRGG